MLEYMWKEKTNCALKPEPFSGQNILSFCITKHLQKINKWMGVTNSEAITEQIRDG